MCPGVSYGVLGCPMVSCGNQMYRILPFVFQVYFVTSFGPESTVQHGGACVFIFANKISLVFSVSHSVLSVNMK